MAKSTKCAEKNTIATRANKKYKKSVKVSKNSMLMAQE